MGVSESFYMQVQLRRCKTEIVRRIKTYRMKKFYLSGLMLVSFLALTSFAIAQSCAGFGATAVGYESRCAATGSIKITASGGSGDYSYKVTGPITTNFTSTDSITGLPAGTYVVTVEDITKNCTFNLPNVVVPGTYNDPRFTLISTDVTCDNGDNGSIGLNTVTNGLAPFEFSIIAPSPMGVGTTNSTGTFTDLKAGIYTIRLTDSCGGIQTRLVTINNYHWQIDSFVFWKISCDTAQGYIRVSDNKGNVSTISGLPGFEYGIVRSPGDTIMSTDPNFSFYLSGANAFEVIVKDPCGNIKKSSVTLTFRSSVGNSVQISNNSCNTYNVSLTHVVNFSNPSFCLLDNNGVELDCNTTGSFSNLAYGNYCINAYDSCSDTTIVRCFTLAPTPASVGTNVAISNKTCYSFTAAITGQIGLTNPNYCLYDSLDNEVACNSTGVFNNLSYAYYCIKVKDSCRDTTITRCFYPERPTPYIPDVISPGYYTCTNFGIIVNGDSLTNPRFCIVDINGDTLTCNTTGVFDSLAYGYYCVVIHDDCYDTTINRCFTVGGPIFNGVINVNTSNQTCSGFTATVVGQGFVNPEYCLYTDAGVLVSCDSSGIFTGLPYGTYYVTAKNECPDTTIIKYFSEQAPWPLVDAAVAQTDKTCGSFTAAITGQQNLTNPSYCLYDHNDTLIACNSTGIFTGLTYNSYCIKVKDGCFDTTLVRCFTATPNPVNIKEYFPGLLKLLFTLAKEKKEGHFQDISQDAETYWFQDLLAQAPDKPKLIPSTPDDTGVLMYTGGTTGISKGAQLTHRCLVANAIQTRHWMWDTREGQEVMMTALPLFHSYAMTVCMNMTIYIAGKMLLIPNPRVLDHVLKTINKHKPSLFPGVPAMYVSITNHPEVSKYDVSSIRACISGAAGLPPEVQQGFEKLTGGKLVEGYGLSEATPVTHCNPIYGKRKEGSWIGIPFPDTVATIRDLETGEIDLGVGEIGELCVQGPQVMKGYWNMPTETANALRDSWLHTGDMARMDSDGFFQVVDRKKDMILGSGGFNVYPREVEDVLYEHPKILEAAVAGIPVGVEKGERIKAFVVLKPGETATEEEILEYCRQNLAYYKVPKSVEFRNELPKTMVGKILRRVLVEETLKQMQE